MYSISNYISCITINEYVKDYRDTDKFILFCKQCNKYGTCWACPPYDFNTDNYILKYDKAYIIGTKITLSDCMGIECGVEKNRLTAKRIITDVRKILDSQLLKLEKEVSDSMAFFAGTCYVCEPEDCTRTTGNVCRYPDKMRHSLESFGFDIGKTTENLLGIELKWSIDGSLPEYLTLVSGLLTNSDIKNIDKYFAESLYHGISVKK